jgi:hypothetical protein
VAGSCGVPIDAAAVAVVLTVTEPTAIGNLLLYPSGAPLVEVIASGFNIGEVSCPTKYFPEASSISFRRSIAYGLGVLGTSLQFRLWKLGLIRPQLFSASPTLRLTEAYYTAAPSEGAPGSDR